MIEVSKEYDGNPAHTHPAFEDPRLTGYGTNNNFGQPSVVWRVPVRFDLPAPRTTSAAGIYGYGRLGRRRRRRSPGGPDHQHRRAGFGEGRPAGDLAARRRRHGPRPGQRRAVRRRPPARRWDGTGGAAAAAGGRL